MRFLSQAWLNENSFTGQIPNMSNCTYLFDLNLESNRLSGLVPPSLSTLSSLKNISLNDNNLQGPIPVFRKDVNASWEHNYFCRSDVGPCDPEVTSFLEVLAAFDYPEFLSFEDSDPCKGMVEPITCEEGKIVDINLGDMQLGGIISPSFFKLTSLVNLTISGNNLTGSIPQSLTTLPQLQLLNVSNNNLTGQIPKFSSKVKLITKGNPLLGLNISRQDGGENATTYAGNGRSSKTTIKRVWIAGMYTNYIFQYFVVVK